MNTGDEQRNFRNRTRDLEKRIDEVVEDFLRLLRHAPPHISASTLGPRAASQLAQLLRDRAHDLDQYGTPED